MAAVGLSGPARAAPTPERYEGLVEEGGVMLERGELGPGAERLSEAYRAMPAEIRVSELGRFIVVRASDAYARAAAEDDLATREASRSLLREFFADLEAARDAGTPTASPDEQEQALAKRLTALDDQIAALEAAEAERAAAEAAEREKTVEIVPVVPVEDDAASTRDGLTIGLLAGGGVLLAGGAVLTIQGARFPGMIERARDEALALYDLSPDQIPPQWGEHEDAQRRQGRILLASGVSLAVVGVAALVWGGVRLAKRKTKAAYSVTPARSRGGAGVVFTVGF